MTILAGIDEAGYGPRLGPLVSSAAAFRCPECDGAAPDLWELLSAAVCRPGRGAAGRLAVGDSKKLYARGSGLARLECGVLGFLGAGGELPGSPGELVGRLLSERCRQSLDDHPWYADRGEHLPLEADAGTTAERAGALADVCSRQGVETVLLAGRLLAEGEFNRRVEVLDNKASVLISLVIDLLRELRRAAGEEPLNISVDRMGGRTDYVPVLSAAFPHGFVWEEERTARRQCYRIDGLEGPTTVEFLVKADASRFPVALASMTSKYLREVFMRRFNAYWQDLDPQVPTTSGYHADAEPFLQAVAEHRRRMGLGRGELVRLR